MIIVLDYNIGKAFLYDTPKDSEIENIEDMITEKGHQLSNCEWMESVYETIQDERKK
jgi:predicted 3-demethylubiquinone-9 3-methyltransferase (glyoxalase superfamily)